MTLRDWKLGKSGKRRNRAFEFLCLKFQFDLYAGPTIIRKKIKLNSVRDL